MDYDPIKDKLGTLFEQSPVTQKVFFRLLDTLFLRAWYVRRTVTRLVRQHGRQPVRVLDAGTGFGQYTYDLVRRFPNVTVRAVDIKDDYLDRARRFLQKTKHANRATFAYADLTKLDHRDEYDLILAVDVMEHILEDRAVFRNFFQALRPGGHVVISTPSDLGGSGISEARQESFIGEHVRDGYNKAELEAKLREAGLEIAESRYTYGLPGSAAWHLLIKWPIQMLNTSWALAPLLALYYIPAFPAGLLLNALDVRRDNEKGTGLLVVGRKVA